MQALNWGRAAGGVSEPGWPARACSPVRWFMPSPSSPMRPAWMAVRRAMRGCPDGQAGLDMAGSLRKSQTRVSESGIRRGGKFGPGVGPQQQNNRIFGIRTVKIALLAGCWGKKSAVSVRFCEKRCVSGRLTSRVADTGRKICGQYFPRVVQRGQGP